MSIIKVKTKGQQLSVYSAPVITSGNVNADTIEFDFDPTWDEYTERYAVFHNDKYGSMQVQLNNDRCEVLSAVLEEEGIFHFGVWGRHSSLQSVKTSELEAYTVVKGTPTDGWSITSWDYFWASFTDTSSIFSGKKTLPTIPPTFTTSNCTNFVHMFSSCSSVEHITIDISKAYTITYMFQNCSNLKTVTFLNPSNKLSDMAYAFNGCPKLTKINGDIDLSNIKYMGYAFRGCNSLKEVRFKENTLLKTVDFSACPLVRDSVLSVLRACKETDTDLNLTFKSDSYSIDIQPQIMEAVNKGWTIAFGNQTFTPEEA